MSLKKILFIIIIIVLTAFLFLGLRYLYVERQTSLNPIKVGVLHSLTGPMAMSESSVADATLLAIDEINKKGGILGRPIQPILVDGYEGHVADLAQKLITQDKVSVIFGCWTSACRKTVKPVIEKHNHLLIYPLQYEGLEQSPNIVYTGAAPNQQIIPAIKWAFDHLGKRFFLVGSDYVFPRTANAMIKDQIKILGGEVVGEEYLMIGSNQVSPIVDKIIAAKPTVIINTINGDSNIAFFNTLRSKDITPDKIPTMSFSLGEEELLSLNLSKMVGDYAAWNYFQSIPTETNQTFVNNFKQKYGIERVVDDPIEAGYFGVYLWAQAVEDAGTDNVNAVRQSIKKQSFNAPEGTVYVDPENQHTWKAVRIGKIRSDGQFDIVWTSEKPIQPVPYPTYRSKEDWDKFLSDLYIRWNEKWQPEEVKPEFR